MARLPRFMAIKYNCFAPSKESRPSQSPGNRIIGANTVRAQQDDLSPPDILVRGVAIPRECLQTAAISGLESDGNSGSHAPDSHAFKLGGIPSRIQMSDAIH